LLCAAGGLLEGRSGGLDGCSCRGGALLWAGAGNVGVPVGVAFVDGSGGRLDRGGGPVAVGEVRFEPPDEPVGGVVDALWGSEAGEPASVGAPVAVGDGAEPPVAAGAGGWCGASGFDDAELPAGHLGPEVAGRRPLRLGAGLVVLQKIVTCRYVSSGLRRGLRIGVRRGHDAVCPGSGVAARLVRV